MFLSIRHYVVRLLLPIIKAVQYLGQPEPKILYDSYEEIVLKSRPGDILLSKEDWRLSNVLIDGFWSHAAICLDEMQVLEALPPKVRTVHLAQFCLSKDSVAVLRPKFKIEFENISEEYNGNPYDFEFTGHNKIFYCSELVAEYIKRISAGKSPFVPRKKWGEETISPQDFYNARDKFELMFEKRN